MIAARTVQPATRLAPRRTALRAALLNLSILLASGTTALAQNADVQIDVTASQNDASQAINNPLLTPTPKVGGSTSYQLVRPNGPNYFQFLLQAPYAYDSNPTLANTGVNESGRFDPSLKLFLLQQIGMVQLNATSGFDIDQYADNSSANAETWVSSLKLAFNQWWPGRVSPYLQYQPALKYNSDYSVLKTETNDVGGGADFALAIPGWSADVDFNFMRRYSSPVNSEALTVKPTFGYVSDDKHWRFLVQPQFRVRWYDDMLGVSRTDETIIAPAILEYDPDFLKIDDDAQGDIEFTVTYTQNFSNIAKDRGAQWVVGPVLEFGLSHSWPKPSLIDIQGH
jgi:hypothetical protein